MRNNMCRLVLSVLSLIIGCAGTVAAQQEQKDRTSVRFTSGLTIIFTSETDPPGHDRNAFGSIQVRGEDNTVHRIFVDRKNSLYFGYDLEVEPIPGSDQFRLTIRPLSAPPISPADDWRARATAGSRSVAGARAQSGDPRPTNLTSRSLPKYPTPQLLHDGDTLALDVLVNPRTGVKIIDLIKVSSTADSSPASFQSGTVSASAGSQTPTNLTPESVELKMMNSWLLVNDQKVIGMDESDGLGVAGSLIWFYIPPYGRFILSLTEHEGYAFQKVGAIVGRKLSFNMDGNRFEWVSAAPIVPSVSGALNLWVLHDSQYQPDLVLGPSPYRIGAANNVKYLITKH
jgi:hypothetical protein